jgi:hypothetical protein
MKHWIFVLTLGIISLFACGPKPGNPEAQQLLATWFSQRFEVMPVEQVQKNDKAIALLLKDRKDADLQLEVKWVKDSPDGGLNKEVIAAALTTAEKHLSRSRELLKTLKTAGYPNLAVGANDKGYTVLSYENPFTSIFSTRMKQFTDGVTKWAATLEEDKTPIVLLFVDPKTQNQVFGEIIPSKYLNAQDAFFSSTYLMAKANAGNPLSLQEMAGTVSLVGVQEQAFRKKAYDAATEFVQAQTQQKVWIESNYLVSSDLDMRRMDRIVYRFPFCKTTEKGGCQGRFDGWVSCTYDLKSGEVYNLNNEGVRSY